MAVPAYAIAVCSRCGADQAPGAALMAQLQAHAASECFHVEPVACLAGCARPLAVAFSAPSKASFLFGDIDPARDVAALLSFGRLYRELADGWCNEGARPEGLRGKTLARIPFSPVFSSIRG